MDASSGFGDGMGGGMYLCDGTSPHHPLRPRSPASLYSYKEVCAARSTSPSMSTASKKISKKKGLEPTEFEDTVAQVRALFDLENNNSDLKTELKDLYINSAVQIDVAGNKKAVVVHVPYLGEEVQCGKVLRVFSLRI